MTWFLIVVLMGGAGFTEKCDSQAACEARQEYWMTQIETKITIIVPATCGKI